jgi:hypothetical protein
MRPNPPNQPDQFATGVVTGMLTLGLFVAVVRVAEWVLAHPQPQAMIDALTAARFSLLDVLAGCLLVLTVVFAVAATYWLPRH